MNIAPYDAEEILNDVLARLPQSLRMVIEGQRNTVFIAGGFVRDTMAQLEPKDIDIFTTDDVSEVKVNAIVSRLGRQVAMSGNSDTFDVEGMPVQVISRWFASSADELFELFDFRCCKVAIEWSDGSWKFRSAGLLTLIDVLGLRLTYCNPVRNDDGEGSIHRAFRLQKRGWHIDGSEIDRIIERVKKSAREGTTTTIKSS